MCYPIAHEYMTAHPAFRDLARMLTREGYAVLRFDYWGTGDSSGDQADATLAQWEESVDLAAAELKDMSGASQLSVIGVRFGAVLAARYAARSRVRDLLLWDPVINGADYLAGLRTLHNTRLAKRRGTPVKAAAATETSVEIAGFLYPDPLREAIGAIDLCRPDGAGGEGTRTPRRTVLVCAEDLPAHRSLEEQLPGKVERHVVEDSSPWDNPGRWGDPLRVHAIPLRIIELLKQGTS
jgi:pimeloyl-ACP methyl ester carboxylesterase